MRTRIVIAPGLSRAEPRILLTESPFASLRSGGGRAHASRHLVNVKEVVDIATRHAGGIEVALIWNRRDKTLVVFAHDALTDEEVVIPVAGEEAAEVYRHPFAYAHRTVDLDLRLPKAERSAGVLEHVSSY